MSIRDLPEELLLQIFWPRHEKTKIQSDVQTPCSVTQAHISSLSVCIRWHVIVKPLICSTYMRPYSVSIRDVEFRLSLDRVILLQLARPNRSLRSFLHTIIERPQLAEHIKRLALDPCVTSIHRHESRMWSPAQPILVNTSTPAQLKQYAKILQKLASSRYHLFSVDEGAEIFFLLSLAPNAGDLYLAQVPLVEKWFSFARSSPRMPSDRHVLFRYFGSMSRAGKSINNLPESFYSTSSRYSRMLKKGIVSWKTGQSPAGSRN
ncbi:hypothetical protein E4T39_05282 [Aureobasidium subglaciale]|nr:hypothetical protein E4T39_05282 [Aureobasidium subglaciale]